MASPDNRSGGRRETPALETRGSAHEARPGEQGRRVPVDPLLLDERAFHVTDADPHQVDCLAPGPEGRAGRLRLPDRQVVTDAAAARPGASTVCSRRGPLDATPRQLIATGVSPFAATMRRHSKAIVFSAFNQLYGAAAVRDSLTGARRALPLARSEYRSHSDAPMSR